MSWFIIVLNGFEALACITGFLYWNKLKHTYWKWFPVYLGIIFLTEITGEYFLHVQQDLKTNIAIYSYFGIPIQFFFFYWIFYHQFRNTKNSKWPLISAAIYLICLLADLAYIGKLEFYFESFSYVVGCLFLLIFLLLFFLQFIRGSEIIRYKQNMMFWVCVGVMVFYIGSMPFFAFRNMLFVKNENLFYIYWYLQFGLNYFMYLFFITAFIWGKPK